MNRIRNAIGGFVLSFLFVGKAWSQTEDKDFIAYVVDPLRQDLAMYWKDDKGQILGSFQHLKDWLDTRQKRLIFAMNGGMYQEDRSPVGLFVQEFEVKRKINKASASGNFYLKPNGIFFITGKKQAGIRETSSFKMERNIRFATQSGPMLLINGRIHPSFTEHSPNVNIRNGVGILPDGRVLLVMSKIAINFFDFARYFQSKGCKNALYLDGFVSKVYLPAMNWYQTGGHFGVIIAETASK